MAQKRILPHNIRVDRNCQPIGTPQNTIPDVQELILLGGAIMAPPCKVGLSCYCNWKLWNFITWERSQDKILVFSQLLIFSSYIFWIKQICNKITWWKRCTFLNNKTWIVCQNLDKFVKFFKICQRVFKRIFLFFCRKYFLGCQRKK